MIEGNFSVCSKLQHIGLAVLSGFRSVFLELRLLLAVSEWSPVVCCCTSWLYRRWHHVLFPNRKSHMASSHVVYRNRKCVNGREISLRVRYLSLSFPWISRVSLRTSRFILTARNWAWNWRVFKSGSCVKNPPQHFWVNGLRTVSEQSSKVPDTGLGQGPLVSCSLYLAVQNPAGLSKQMSKRGSLGSKLEHTGVKLPIFGPRPIPSHILVLQRPRLSLLFSGWARNSLRAKKRDYSGNLNLFGKIRNDWGKEEERDTDWNVPMKERGTAARKVRRNTREDREEQTKALNQARDSRKKPGEERLSRWTRRRTEGRKKRRFYEEGGRIYMKENGKRVSLGREKKQPERTHNYETGFEAWLATNSNQNR